MTPSLYRHRLFNRHPRACIGMLDILETLSQAHALPAEVIERGVH